jgi:hypothetical protein
MIEMLTVIVKTGDPHITPGHVDISIITMIISRVSVASNLSSLYGRKFKKESSFRCGE